MSSQAPSRRYPPQFKLQLSQVIRSGAIGRRDAGRHHNLSTNLLQLWLTQYDRGELSTEEAEASIVADYEARIAALEHKDRSWLVFTSLVRTWGLTLQDRWGIGLILLLISALIVSTLAARQLARPISLLSSAVHRFGLDPQAAPITETGPRELRQVTATSMQCKHRSADW